MAETTHAYPSIRHCRRHTIEADRLRIDVAEHVGAPTSLRRHRQPLDMFTRYMDLMSNFIVTEPSSFEESVQQPIWVDAWLRSMTPSSRTMHGNLSQD